MGSQNTDSGYAVNSRSRGRICRQTVCLQTVTVSSRSRSSRQGARWSTGDGRSSLDGQLVRRHEAQLKLQGTKSEDNSRHAEDDSNYVVTRPTISNKDNGRIRSYTYSVSDRSDPNTGACSLCGPASSLVLE